MQAAHCGRHPHYDHECQLCEAAYVVNALQAARARLDDRDLVALDGRVFAGNVIPAPVIPASYRN